jgi:hypothetical protein
MIGGVKAGRLPVASAGFDFASSVATTRAAPAAIALGDPHHWLAGNVRQRLAGKARRAWRAGMMTVN